MFDLPNNDGGRRDARVIGDWCKTANGKSIMIELSGYVFETLREDEEFAFCRGRRDKGELPTILLVAPVSEHPVPAILERLELGSTMSDASSPMLCIASLSVRGRWRN